MRTIICFLVLISACSACFASSPVAVSVEKGRYVGEGLVLDPLPYDPKSVGEMTFVSPAPDHPFYEVVAPLGDWDGGAGAAVTKVTVNGIAYPAFNLYIEGEAHYSSTWITRKSPTAKNVVIAVRVPWHNGEAIALEVTCAGTDGEKVLKAEGQAPASGGAPEGWRRYQSVTLRETEGLAREAEPVEFSLAARAENCGDLAREIRLFSCENGILTPTDCQTFGAQEFLGTPPGTSNDNYLQHPSRSINVVFLASVPARGAKVYVAFYDNPHAPALAEPATDLVVSGPSLGATVENSYYRVELHPECGQIASFELKNRGDHPAPLLTNSYSRAVHWNPDSFSDNGKWGPHLRVGSAGANHGDGARPDSFPRNQQRADAGLYTADLGVGHVFVLRQHALCAVEHRDGSPRSGQYLRHPKWGSRVGHPSGDGSGLGGEKR